MIVISLVERSRTELTPAQWHAVRGETGFWALADEGVVKVVQLGADRVALEAGNQVGRLVAGDTRIDVAPKISGAVEALFATVAPDLRVLDLPSPASDPGELFRHVVHAFIQVVKTYLQARDWEYVRQHERGSLVGGRLRMSATARLRARGIRHQVAFERTVLTRATPINAVIGYALMEVERLASELPISPADLTGARTYAVLFHDCLPLLHAMGTRAAVLRIAYDLAASERDSTKRRAIELATAVIGRQSFEPVGPSRTPLPIAWFVNMELLFERALQAAFGRVSAPRVTHGTALGRPILNHLAPVNPDYAFGDVPCIAIGDAKYKFWDEATDRASDLYQLVAHAQTLESSRAFLAYPHTETAIVPRGATPFGVEVWSCAVDVRDLDGAAAMVCAQLGVPISRSRSGNTTESSRVGPSDDSALPAGISLTVDALDPAGAEVEH